MMQTPESWNLGFASGIEDETEHGDWDKKKAKQVLKLKKRIRQIWFTASQ